MRRLIIVMLMLIALVTWFVIRTTDKTIDDEENTELIISPLTDSNSVTSLMK